MPEINSLFINDKRTMDPIQLKSGWMRKHMNTTNNTIVGFINNKKQPTLTFVLEKKCNQHTLLSLSKLFLTTIQLNYSNLFSIQGFNLHLSTQKISNHRFHCGEKSSLFCHEIHLWTIKNTMMLASSTIPPKEFAITILNHFQGHTTDIFSTNTTCI